MGEEKNWLAKGLDRAPAALVTGGSWGLGRALAGKLLDHGFTVFICARTQADLDDAVAQRPQLHAIRTDVTSAADRERLFATMAEACNGRPLDLLVNNAAIVRAHDYASPFTLAPDRAADEIACNLAAPIELARLFLKRREGVTTPGAIMNVSTPGALFPLDANPLYCATKAGLHMFTHSLRRHLAQTPVKVIEVFPPSLDTRLADQLDVAGQAANGEATIAAVAAETVEGLLAGAEIIAPHEQSRQLLQVFPLLDEARVDMVNRGVKRRAGWDS